MMNFHSALQFLSLPTYSFRLQYLFIVGSLPQSITRVIPNETECNQISKKIKTNKTESDFLLSKLGPALPFSWASSCFRRLWSQMHWRLCRGSSYRVVCTHQEQVVSFPYRVHVSQHPSASRFLWTRTNATDEHFLGTFVPIYLFKFQQIFSWKKKASGRKGWRVGIFSFSLEKRSDSLQLHLRDLIKLPWSGQHAWPLLRLWFDWCSFTRKWRIKPEWRLNFAPFRWNWEICLVNEKLNKVYIWVNWSNAAWIKIQQSIMNDSIIKQSRLFFTSEVIQTFKTFPPAHTCWRTFRLLFADLWSFLLPSTLISF